MRIRTMAVLGFTCGLFVLWMGCTDNQTGAKRAAHAPRRGLARQGEACATDADCRAGFCDRATCVESFWFSFYGKPCDPPAPDARPVDKLPERICGGYLCVDGRCRSCRFDGECYHYYGVGRCLPIADGSPVRMCEPATTRINSQFPCNEDAQCQSLFCDRRTCEETWKVDNNNYGEACEPGPPRAPPEDLRVGPPGGMCEGYLCIDGRCRSCETDAECQAGGSSDLKCLAFSSWGGKVCVTLSQAARPPEHVVPSIAPRINIEDD